MKVKKSILLGLLLFLSAPVATFAQPSKVTLCNDPWPPFTVGKSGSAPEGGLAFEIVNEIFDRMDGVSVEMQLMPWKRCLKQIETGKIDGAMLALKSAKRPYLRYPKSVFAGRVGFFYHKEKHPNGISWEKPEDLAGLRVGFLAGTKVSPAIQAAMDAGVIKADKAKDASLNFNKLRKGRIDLAISNEPVGFALIKEKGWQGEFAVTKKPVEESPYYMPLGHKSPALELIPKINVAIESMIADGFIQKVVAE